MPGSGYTIEFVTTDWERFAETVALSFAVLYEPFGVGWAGKDATAADWVHPGPDTLIAIAITPTGELLGSARLLGCAGDERRQVRQVAVFPHVRRGGVGRALMHALEARAAEEGARETWLNARDTAYVFYESLGYELQGEGFVSELTGIPHRAACKRLG